MIAEVRLGNDRAPVIFIPGLGGEDEHTRRLTLLLARDFEVEIFLTPDVETPCGRIFPIAELAKQIAEQVRATGRGSDTIIAGYSIGGLLAYEAARLLSEEGRSPACVALFDTSPHPVDGRPFYFLREAIQAFRKRPLDASGNILLLLFAMLGQLGSLRLLVRRGLAGRHAGRPDKMRKKLLLYLWRKSIARFELQPSPARVILFAAESARPGVFERTRGWETYARDLEVVDLRGNHWTMLHPKQLRQNSVHILSALIAQPEQPSPASASNRAQAGTQPASGNKGQQVLGPLHGRL